jgi:hypothetical protein
MACSESSRNRSHAFSHSGVSKEVYPKFKTNSRRV